MIRRTFLICTAACAGALAASAAGAQTVHATLIGYHEVPAVASPATGRFKAKIDEDAGMVFWELSYEGLQTTAFMSHIHFGQRSVNGGISVWLCGTPNVQPGQVIPAGLPTCPAQGGTLNGSFGANAVIGPAGQLIGATQLQKLIDAMRAGVTYVNVHTSTPSGGVPSGEIRGQIRPADERNHGRGKG
jgi:hypothetical protein